MPYSVLSNTTKRGSRERSGPRFDHDRARPSKELKLESQDVFSVLRPISGASRRLASKSDNADEDEVTTTGLRFLDGSLCKADLPADDGDPWVDTDSVGSESGTDLIAMDSSSSPTRNF